VFLTSGLVKIESRSSGTKDSTHLFQPLCNEETTDTWQDRLVSFMRANPEEYGVAYSPAPMITTCNGWLMVANEPEAYGAVTLLCTFVSIFEGKGR
jgi:hypothetical protein